MREDGPPDRRAEDARENRKLRGVAARGRVAMIRAARAEPDLGERAAGPRSRAVMGVSFATLAWSGDRECEESDAVSELDVAVATAARMSMPWQLTRGLEAEATPPDDTVATPSAVHPAFTF